MEIIISGSSGFIGKNLIRYILKNIKKKCKIIALYNNHLPTIKNDNVIYKKFDIENDEKLTFVNKKSIFIHLAWNNLPNYDSTTHITKHLNDQKKFIKKVIEKKPKKLFVLGTCFEYQLQNSPIDEKTQIKPKNNYAKGKNLLRKYIERTIDRKTIFIWGRLFYVYGPNQQNHTLYKQYLMHKMNKKTFLLKQSNLELDYLHVNQVCKYIYFLSVNSKINSNVNICSGKKISLENLINFWSKRKFTNNHKKDDKSFFGSNLKLKKILSEF
jgi:dTDP-6-deoxy-L-talose 4-dehydrogenase (NAD+)